jgi:hypothetical protein
MPIQYSVAVRNAQLDAIETTVGASPILRILTGSPPADCAAAQTGTVLASITLPADWQSAASGGVKSLLGTWQGTGSAAGTAGYYRVLNSAGIVCHEQGTITATGGGGDLTLDNTSIASGQTITITSFTRTAANA